MMRSQPMASPRSERIREPRAMSVPVRPSPARQCTGCGVGGAEEGCEDVVGGTGAVVELHGVVAQAMASEEVNLLFQRAF